MKFIEFFLRRPVSAVVINLLLMVCGVLAYQGLTIDEYPQVVVSRLSIATSFRNASVQTVEKEITIPIEEGLAAVQGVENISSTSEAQSSRVTVTFAPGVSMDRAVSDVNEKISKLLRRLPKDADLPRVSRSGNDSDNQIYLAVNSDTLTGADLSHFALTHIKSYFQGLDGVARVSVFGPRYAMKIELDPVAMDSQRISPSQVAAVLQKHELMLQAGQMRSLEPITLDVVAKNAKDYQDLIVGKNAGAPTRLADIASVQFLEDDRDDRVIINGQDAVMLAIGKTSDGNVLAISSAIKQMLPKVNAELHGVATVSVNYDKSIFVAESLKTIIRSIIEACILVVLVILLFLRHVRATLVPLVAIPISLVATFFAMRIFGLSINTITLLALALCVGLVVDDAIVVLENIVRYREQGLGPFEAARKGAREIGFAIIAMTCTLMSVFLPLAFVSDVVGTLLKEFAITLAAAVFFSGIVALTLSPFMCVWVLKTHKENRLTRFLETGLKIVEHGYARLLHRTFERRGAMYLALLLALGLGIFAYTKLPSDLVPKEDRGLIGAWMEPIPGFDVREMDAYVAAAEHVFQSHPEIMNHLLFASPEGVQFLQMLSPWQERKKTAAELVDEVRQEMSAIPSVTVYPWSWDIGLDALREGTRDNAGIALSLRSNKSYEEINHVAQAVVDQIAKSQVLQDAHTDFNLDKKAFNVILKREPMSALGVLESDVSVALQTFTDRMRASEFRFEGERYDVFLTLDKPFTDLSDIPVVTNLGSQVPLVVVADVTKTFQAAALAHQNQMRAVTILANLADGKSQSEAISYLDGLVSKLVPEDISVAYEGSIAAQKKSDQTFALLFLAGLIFIFAIMAMQFESVVDPLIILCTVPLALIGGVLSLWIAGSGTNIYTHVGMLTLVGLITKHGILLTEFVATEVSSGLGLKEAVLKAASLRFRPIIMTTAATVLGALPLIMTRGAGMEARGAVGLVIVGGMIFGTLLTLLVLPSFIFTVHTGVAKYLRRAQT